MKKKTPSKGISFLLCFGRYGGFYIKRYKETGSLRICLGWAALTCFMYDVESAFDSLLKEADKIK